MFCMLKGQVLGVIEKPETINDKGQKKDAFKLLDLLTVSPVKGHVIEKIKFQLGVVIPFETGKRVEIPVEVNPYHVGDKTGSSVIYTPMAA